MSKVKISGFYDEASSNLEEQIKLIKQFGETYLCPRSINGKNIANYTAEEFEKEVKPILDKNGIKLSSLGSPIGKIGLYDDEAYEAQKKKLVELVKICQMTGCKYIRMFSFRVKKGNYDEYFPVVVEKIKGFLEIVKGTDVVLLHENEKRIYGDIPERVLQLHEAINDPQFKLCFDASNYIQCGVSAPKAYEMLKDLTVYYHIKDCSLEKVEVPVGLGEGGYEDMIYDLVVNRNYDGFLTLEPHTDKYASFKNIFNCVGWFTWCLPIIGNWHKIFRRIDKMMNVKKWQKVEKKTAVIWQYEGLVNLINKAEEKASKAN